MSDPVIFILVLIAGFFTGMLSGVFGVGGAVISTPAILVLGATPLQAVGSTLPSIIPSSIAGTFRYTRDGLVRRRVVLFTGLAGASAAAAGAIASDRFPGRGHVQMVMTAGLMAFTAYRTATGGRTPPTLDHHGERQFNLAPLPLIGIGIVAGLLSGFLGVGGGIVMIPAFTAIVGLELKEAIGTSLACVGLIAIPGSLTHQLLGNVNWFYAVPLMISAIPGARVGAHLAISTPDRTLRIVVAAVLGTISIGYGIAEFVALFT